MRRSVSAWQSLCLVVDVVSVRYRTVCVPDWARNDASANCNLHAKRRRDANCKGSISQ
jgi:hypothetical protein